MAKFTTLYSGSSGNCAWISDENKYLLVDMGKSCRKTVQSLKELDAPISNLAGILITHEHSDHVSGLAVFLKNYNVPVYGTAKTLDYLYANNLVPATARLLEIDGQTMDIGGFGVESFATSHDSVDCCGYRITTSDGKIASVATDLGYVSHEVLANLLLADFVSLEANYDYDMLMAGSYPYYLKKRIASQRGHLCNEESAQTVIHLIKNGCKKIALCHISQENNTPLLVGQTVKEAILKENIVLDSDSIIQPALRNEISPIITF